MSGSVSEDCPLGCGRRVRSTCAGCGLWWVDPANMELLPRAGHPILFTDQLQLTLRSSVPGVGTFVFVSMGVLGIAAALAGLHSVAHRPDEASAWLALVVGLPLGGFVAVGCFAVLAQMLLGLVVPSRIEGDSAAMTVRVWHTWDGVADGFRRTQVSIPRAQVKGVLISLDQARQSMLFVLHASGMAFGTGWSGSRAMALEHGEALNSWISGAGEESPSTAPLNPAGNGPG